MELKDFKIPLLSNFVDIGEYTGIGATEEAAPATMEDAVIEIGKMIDERLAQSYTMMDEIVQLRVTNDENFLVYLTESDLVVWDVKTKERKSKPLQYAAQFLELCRGDTLALVAKSGDTKITAYYLATLEVFKVLDTHKARIQSLFLSPNQRMLVTTMEDEEVLKWELEGNQLGKCSEIASDRFSFACFSHESNEVLLINDKKLYMCSLSGKEAPHEANLDMPVMSAKFAPSGSFIALVLKQSIKIVKPENFAVIQELPLPEPIKSMVIAKFEDMILIGTESGKIIVWDIKNKRDLIRMTVHNSAVNNIILSNDEKVIFSTEVSQTKKVFTTKFPELNIWKKLDCTGVLGFAPTNDLFIKGKTGVSLHNLKTGETSELSKIEGISNVLYAGLNKVVVCHLHMIMVIDTETNESRTVGDDIDLDTPVSLVATREGDLLFTGGKQKIKVWDLNNVSAKAEWKAHEDIVTCLLLAKSDTRLISGSQDNQIKIWEYKEGGEQIPLNTLFGHLGIVNAMRLTTDNERLLLSAGSDKTIRVWNWEQNTLLCTLNQSDNITGLHTTQEGKFFISSSVDGKITYWSMKTFTEIFYNQVQDNIKKLYVSPDDAYISFTLQGGDCYAVANPLVSKTMTVSGPTMDYYQYLRYLKSIINLIDIPEHMASMNDWVILPYFLTAPHFYAYSNLPLYMRSSLENEFKTVESSFGATTLSISMEKDYRDCRNMIMKSMVRNYRDNPYALACITKQCFIDLNNEGYRFLVKIYDLIFRRCVGYNLPKNISSKKKTPAYCHSKDVIPYASSFWPQPVVANPQDSIAAPSAELDILDPVGEPTVISKPAAPVAVQEEIADKSVFFMHALVPFNISAGSSESLDFLRSILASPNSDIFRTKFIQSILQGKWNQVRWYMYSQGIVYTLYLISLSFYVLYFQNDLVMLALPFSMSVLLTSYEIYQAVLAPLEYLEDIWNYIDSARAILFIVYSIMAWAGADPDAIYTFLMLVSFLSWLRGITYFRLNPPTRYMINLLTEVFKDMLSFLILLFYSTLAFSFIFLVLDVPEERNGLAYYVSFSYLINLGSFDLEGMGLLESLVFFIVTMINPVVMMNLLISIVGDTHDRVQESLDIADNKELAEMILEVETLFFWKRGDMNETYLQLCLEDEYGEGTSWAGKVRELKVMMKQIKEAQSKSAQQSSEEVKTIREQISTIEKSVQDDNKVLKEYIEQMRRNQQEIIKRISH